MVCESWSKLYGTLLLHQMMRDVTISAQYKYSQVYISLLYSTQIFFGDQNKISNFYSIRANAATMSAFVRGPRLYRNLEILNSSGAG